MKKKLGFIISGVVAIAILGFGVLYSSTSQAEASMSAEDISKMVTQQYPGEITEIEQETEFNRTVYEVEIRTDDKEYDIKLDGKTGEILNVSEKPIKNKDRENSLAKAEKEKIEENKEKEDKAEEQPKKVVINEKKEEQPKKQENKEQAAKDQKAKEQAAKDQKAREQAAKDQKAREQAAKDQKAREQAAKDQKAREQAAKDQKAREQAAKDQKAKEQKAKEQKPKEQKKAIISYEEAKRIALNAFAGEIDDIELDSEDGRLIYEVEIERGDKEAEIEIDAYTGKVIMIEIDED